VNSMIVKFKGFEFLLFENALTSYDAVSKGQISFAHVYDNGLIMCFDHLVGCSDELEIISEDIEEPIVGPNVLFALTTWTRESWEKIWFDRKHILEEAIK
jgi:hypothetical protein